MSEAWKERGRSWFRPLGGALARLGVEPDHLTIAGLGFSRGGTS